MKRRISFIALGVLVSLNVLAQSFLPTLISNPENIDNSWSILASLGYTEYQHVYRADGRTLIGRFAFAAELLTTKPATFGLELGIQTGNHMHLDIPQSTLETLGYAVRTTVKPMLDLLITANANLLSDSLFFTQIKGGIAYRHWKIDNIWINNKSELAGELQAGLGYPLTEISNLNLLYQGIFGGYPKLRVNPLTEAGILSNIPIQHGVLFGFSIIA